MPFTPYHLGPGLFLGILFLNLIDFPTFLIASVIVDIEPFLVMYFNLDYPLHGFFHSFLGGTIIALILSVVMTQIRKYLTPIMSFLKIEQKISFKRILIASLLGIYIHILLDSPLYTDIRPFFPFNFNPFYSDSNLTGVIITWICIWCLLGAIALYTIRLIIFQVKINRNEYKSDKKSDNNLEETNA
ncbi:MAG: hydrolase [Promethearchaeota archaeon]